MVLLNIDVRGCLLENNSIRKNAAMARRCAKVSTKDNVQRSQRSRTAFAMHENSRIIERLQLVSKHRDWVPGRLVAPGCPRKFSINVQVLPINWLLKASPELHRRHRRGPLHARDEDAKAEVFSAIAQPANYISTDYTFGHMDR